LEDTSLAEVTEERIPVHEKSRGETINVYIGEYAGRKYLHIREWYLDKDQEEKPTKKGVAIPVEKVEALRDAIDKLLPAPKKK
jgi:hypothetical protein